MLKGFSIGLAIVALVAIALSTVAVIGAFVVVDERAAQIIEPDSSVAPAARKSTPSARSGSRAAAYSRPPRTSKRAETAGSGAGASTGEPSSAFATMDDSRHERHGQAHRRHRMHHRH